MIITEKDSKFEAHPASNGQIRAVVVDVTEPLLKDTKWGQKEKFAIVFETEMVMEDGKNWTHWDHGYTPSIAEKSTLRKNAQKILGTALPSPFDTETLIGKPVILIIEHQQKDEKVFANIGYIKADDGPNPMKPSGNYVRQKDKDRTNAGGAYQKAGSAPEEKLPWQQTKVHVGKFAGSRLEDLDTEAVQNLIQHWLPSKQDPAAKVTADDRRLMTALAEVQKVLAGQQAVNEVALY